MGVPKFYKWLSERFPLITQKITPDTPVPEFGMRLYILIESRSQFVQTICIGERHHPQLH